MLKKFNIILLGIILASSIVYGSYKVFEYQATKQQTVVKASNVREIIIRDSKEYKEIAKISDPEKTIKLNRWEEYFIQYEGKEGYESGEFVITIDEKTHELLIDPDYSEERLNNLLVQELPLIRAGLEAKYPPVFSMYEVSKSSLLKKGDWYGGLLKYTGSDRYNNDRVRVLLKKEGGKWVLLTSPPDLSLDIYNYKDVPSDVLDSVNAL